MIRFKTDPTLVEQGTKASKPGGPQPGGPMRDGLQDGVLPDAEDQAPLDLGEEPGAPSVKAQRGRRSSKARKPPKDAL